MAGNGGGAAASPLSQRHGTAWAAAPYPHEQPRHNLTLGLSSDGLLNVMPSGRMNPWRRTP